MTQLSTRKLQALWPIVWLDFMTLALVAFAQSTLVTETLASPKMSKRCRLKCDIIEINEINNIVRRFEIAESLKLTRSNFATASQPYKILEPLSKRMKRIRWFSDLPRSWVSELQTGFYAPVTFQ